MLDFGERGPLRPTARCHLKMCALFRPHLLPLVAAERAEDKRAVQLRCNKRQPMARGGKVRNALSNKSPPERQTASHKSVQRSTGDAVGEATRKRRAKTVQDGAHTFRARTLTQRSAVTRVSECRLSVSTLRVVSLFVHGHVA